MISRIIMALCMAGILFPQPNNGSTSDKDKSAGNPPQAVIPAQNEVSKADAKKTDSDPEKWYTALEGPDWWVVIIAAITGAVIAWQVIETRRATEAMRDSIAVQEVSLKQWVELTNWTEVAGEEPWTYTESGGKITHCPDSMVLDVRFCVENNTEKPFTVVGITTEVAIDGRKLSEDLGKDLGAGDHADKRVAIAPKGDYLLSLQALINRQEVVKYLLNDLRMTLEVAIFYENVLNKLVRQSFSIVLAAGVNHTADIGNTAKEPETAKTHGPWWRFWRSKKT